MLISKVIVVCKCISLSFSYLLLQEGWLSVPALDDKNRRYLQKKKKKVKTWTGRSPLIWLHFVVTFQIWTKSLQYPNSKVSILCGSTQVLCLLSSLLSFTESPNGWGWEGTLEVFWSNRPAQEGTPILCAFHSCFNRTYNHFQPHYSREVSVRVLHPLYCTFN